MKLANPDQRRIFTEVEIVAHPKSLDQPRQDQGYWHPAQLREGRRRRHAQRLEGPGVGDRVLVTLRIDVRKKRALHRGG